MEEGCNWFQIDPSLLFCLEDGGVCTETDGCHELGFCNCFAVATGSLETSSLMSRLLMCLIKSQNTEGETTSRCMVHVPLT